MKFTEATINYASMKQPTAKEVSAYREDIEDAVNVFGFDPKKELEGIISTKENTQARRFLVALSAEWVNYWTSMNRWVDGRNEYSAKICREIASDPEFRDFYENARPDIEGRVTNLVLEIGSRTHRTLVQTISELMFYVVACESEKLNDAMASEYGNNWWNMPLV